MAGCPAPKTRIANLEFRPVIQSNGGAAQRNCLLDPQNIICWSLSQLVSLKPPWAQPLFLLFCLCPLFLSSFSNKCLTTSNKKLVETRIRRFTLHVTAQPAGLDPPAMGVPMGTGRSDDKAPALETSKAADQMVVSVGP